MVGVHPHPSPFLPQLACTSIRTATPHRKKRGSQDVWNASSLDNQGVLQLVHHASPAQSYGAPFK